MPTSDREQRLTPYQLVQLDKEEALVDALGELIGYGRVMQAAEACWKEYARQHGHSGSEHTVGPCACMLVRCEGEAHEDGFEGGCDWCAGTGRVTKRVAEVIHASK